MSGPLDGKYLVRPNGCWEWQRAIQTNGYGSVGYQGKTHLAHRLSYQLNVGPVPAGYDVHHKCTNRRCINPAHLELQLHKLHPFLADNPFTRNAKKTHCDRGHALSGENLYIDSHGKRQCRKCSNGLQRARRRRLALAAKESQHGH